MINEDNEKLPGNSSDRPLPIDIDALLEELREYRKELGRILENGLNPENIIHRERFVDCILVMENDRTAADLSRPDLDAHCFEDTKDMMRYLQHVQRTRPEIGQAEWRSITPRTALDVHDVVYEVRIENSRIDIVAFEPATKKMGVDTINELTKTAEDFPGVVHNAAVVVSNVQKASFGCPSHGVVGLLKNSRFPEGINELFKMLSQEEGGKFKLIIDSYGNILDYSAYIHAQSETQVHGVIDNPRWYGLIDLEQDPLNRKEQSFLSHHTDSRVTRFTKSLGQDSGEVRTFSNSIDHKRPKSIDRLSLI